MSSHREHFTTKIGFMMAAIGSAIGLGILWKFPYVTGENGGGLFLISYLIFVICIGVPLFIGEVTLGRITQKAAVKSFDLYGSDSTLWPFGAWMGVLSSLIIMSFYSVIAGYGMSYVWMSLSGVYDKVNQEQIPHIYDKLSSSSFLSLFWHFIFTAITAVAVYMGVRKGIERWSKVLVQFFLALLVVLFAYSLTLSGFQQALTFAFSLNYSQFTLSSLLEALGLAFFTLSLGQGIMISYGSYMPPKENIVRTSLIVALSVVVVAILAILTIFPVVFTFGLSPSEGPGLVFKTLPYLFAKLPAPALLSTLFFSLFVFTALTSAIPLIEVVASNLMEIFGVSRTFSVVLVAVTCFLLGVPSALSGSTGAFPEWETIYRYSFLETLNRLVSIWMIPLAGLFTSLYIGWKVPTSVLKKQLHVSKEVSFMYDFWVFMLKYVIPFLIALIMLEKGSIIQLGY